MSAIILPVPPDDEPVAAGVSTTTAMTDLVETLGVLSIAAAFPALLVKWWLLPILIAAGVLLFVWAAARREEKAEENELELREPKYRFTAAQLASLGRTDLTREAGTVLAATLPPGERVSRWQLVQLLGAEMGESRASETLPNVLRYASK